MKRRPAIGLAICFLFVGAIASQGAPRYVSFQERLKGVELSSKEARDLLEIIKTPLYKKSKSHLAACNLQENIFLAMERSVLFPFFSALKKKDFTKAASFADTDLVVKGNLFANRSSLDGLRVFGWDQSESSLVGLFEAYAAFESLVGETLFVRFEPEANKARHESNQVALRIELDARGTTVDGLRAHSTGNLLVRLARKGGVWKITEINANKGQTVAAESKPAFQREDNSKLFKTPLIQHRRVEAIRRGGYGLSVNDYNGDGKPDIYVGGVLQSQSFLNQGDGTFAADSNVPSNNLVKSVAFADFDNDGHQDLLVVRFVPVEVKASHKGQTAVTVYRNLGGRVPILVGNS